MAVTVLFGQARSGKTTYCFEQMATLAVQDFKTMLLVPDQATYDTERRFADFMPGKGFMGVSITGFTRLAYHVLQERGKEKTPLSDLGKTLILQRLLRRYADRFTVLQTAARQPGFAAAAGQFLWECRSFCVTADDLRRCASTVEEGPLARKLKDMALLYEVYEAFLAERFGSVDDTLTMLTKEVGTYTYLQGAQVWVDGFQWFTAQQLAVLKAIAAVAANVTITLTMDRDRLPSQRKETALFHRAYEVYNELKKAFPTLQVHTVRYNAADELMQLRDDFFHVVPRQAPVPLTRLHLTECSSREVEIDGVARKIMALVQTGHCYRDFLVIVRNTAQYCHFVERIFRRYGIPCFSDYRRPMHAHPAAEAVVSLLQVLTGRWNHEAVFQLLKTDLIDLPRQAVDELENYCLAYGIRGDQWLSEAPWQYTEMRFPGQRLTSDEADMLRHINELREAVRKILLPFWQEGRGEKSLRQWCTLLYHWLLRLGIPEKLEAWQRADEEAGQMVESREHEQVWKRIVEILGEIVTLCGDDTVSVGAFSEIIEDAFDGSEFTLIPPTLDHVTLTAIDRGYTLQGRVVFICGLNHGVFPQVQTEDALFNDTDRRSLDTVGLHLAPSSRFRSFQERFLFYLALTRARDELWLSYVLTDEEGKQLPPAAWVRQLLEKNYIVLLRRLKELMPAGEEKEYLYTLSSALTYLPQQLQPAVKREPVGDIWWGLYDWALQHAGGSLWQQSLGSLFYHNQACTLAGKTVRKLFAPDGSLRGSVTRFEQYRQCPFAYFAKYGLGLRERETYQFDAANSGVFVHGALCAVSEELLRQGKQWRDLAWGEIETICREAAEAWVPYIRNNILAANGYYQEIKTRLVQTLVRKVRILVLFSRASAFEMAAVEASFGRDGHDWEPLRFTLPGGLDVVLTGQIDRVDVLRRDGKTFIVVIDYKSGRKSLDLLDVYAAVELQLLTYMAVALQHFGSGAAPAAVLYCRVRNDKVSFSRLPEEREMEQAYHDHDKVQGFFTADFERIRSLDKTIDSGSQFLEVTFNKDGSVPKNSTVLYNDGDWDSLLSLVRQRIGAIAAAIDAGKIDIAPLKRGNQTACVYCAYHGICAFDSRFRGNSYTVPVITEKKKVMEILRQEGGAANGLD